VIQLHTPIYKGNFFYKQLLKVKNLFTFQHQDVPLLNECVGASSLLNLFASTQDRNLKLIK